MTTLDAMVWFDEEQRVDNLLWNPSPASMENDLDLLLEAWIKRPYKTHIVVMYRLMTLLWRRQNGKEADLLFTIPVGTTFWGLEEHEPLIIALFLTIVSRRERRGLWNIRGSELAAGTVRELEG